MSAEKVPGFFKNIFLLFNHHKFKLLRKAELNNK